MIHTGKKSISLSLDELSVLAVGFTRKRWGREADVFTLGPTNTLVCTHTYDCTAMTTDSLLTGELGNTHVSLKRRRI